MKDNNVINVVSVKSLKENEKLPKCLIKRFSLKERKYGITDFRCSVAKSYSYDHYTNLKITGELKGRTNRYMLMMFMIYNRNNELIEMNCGETLSDDFNGDLTFSETIQVPCDEYITEIVVKFIPDPVFL